jgi:hypothetical protein
MLPHNSIYSLVLDPVNPSILYAGTNGSGAFSIELKEHLVNLPLVRR